MPDLYEERRKAPKATLMLSPDQCKRLENPDDLVATFIKFKGRFATIDLDEKGHRIVFSFANEQERTSFTAERISFKGEGKDFFEWKKPEPRAPKKHLVFVQFPDVPAAATEKDLRSALAKALPGITIEHLKRGGYGPGLHNGRASAKVSLENPTLDLPTSVVWNDKRIPVTCVTGHELGKKIKERETKKKQKEKAKEAAAVAAANDAENGKGKGKAAAATADKGAAAAVAAKGTAAATAVKDVAAAKKAADRSTAAKKATTRSKENTAGSQRMEPATPTQQVLKPADQLANGPPTTSKKRKIEELSPLSPSSPPLPKLIPEDPLEREAPTITKTFLKRVGLPLPRCHAALVIYEDVKTPKDVETIDKSFPDGIGHVSEEVRKMHRNDDDEDQGPMDWYVMRQTASNDDDDEHALACLYSSYAFEVTEQYFVRQGWVQKIFHQGATILILYLTRMHRYRKSEKQIDRSLKE